MRNTYMICNEEDYKSDILKTYFKEMQEIKPVSPKKERELVNQARNGDENARDILIRSNLRLVVSIAKKYQGYGLPLIDLIQEGNTGLITSIDKYDESKRNRFITYASWWIKYSIKKAITDNSRTLRMPSSQYNCYQKVNKAILKFEQQNYRVPTEDELVDITGLKRNQVLVALGASDVTLPLEYSDPNGDLISYSNILPDKEQEPTDNEIITDYMVQYVHKILRELPRRERNVLKSIYGIGCRPKKIKEIAERYGLTYERIRQIKKGALRTLKETHPELGEEYYTDFKK